jgi:hypothetical protein
MNTLVFTVLFAVCFVAPASGVTIQRPTYTITADDSITADAEQVAELTDSAIRAISAAFPDWDVLQAIQGYNLQIVIHATPNDAANEGTATLFTSNSNGILASRLDILALSRYSAAARTNVGEPKEHKYFERLLIHEISTLLFERVTAKKSCGWRFQSAPSWFVQGLEQYVAFRQTSAKQSLQLYLDRVRRDPNIVQTDFGVQVTDPYIGGTVLLAFIDEHYGWPTVQKLLESPEATFGAAVRKQLGVTLESFVTEFQSWLTPK